MELVFATGNRHKLAEIEAMLGGRFVLKTPFDLGITEDIPENEPTIEGNASSKAWYLYNKAGVDCFADDTGLEVEALNGEPGVYSARYAGEAKSSQANMELLLRNLEGKSNRRARFRTVISLIIAGKEHCFEGVVDGEITLSLSGSEGFGYDPIFRPDGFDTTFAEMSAEQKNMISHRGRATTKLIDYLQQLNG